MTRRPDRIDAHEDGVVVAIDCQIAQPEDVAGRFALSPQSVPRARVEVDLAG
jgi:hypothetical protein